MQGQLADGWHISRQGASYGPYSWTDLVTWARDGRLLPADLVWQPELSGWMPAKNVPGLFAIPPTPSRRGLRAILAGAAVVVLAGIAVGVLFAAGVFSERIPLVETPMQGPTVIDVSYDLAELAVAPDQPASLEAGGVELVVPPGAVDTDTTLEVRLLDDGFHTSDSIAPDDQAFQVSQVVDFGPTGATFNKPVTITLPYDEELLPAGTAEEDLVLGYWNGESWVTIPAFVDTKRNTASASLKEFAGVSLVVVGLGAVIVSSVGCVAYKLTRTDAIVQGRAHKWITPKDPVVKEMAQSATVGGVKLTDQKSLAVLLEQQQQGMPLSLNFTASDGTVVDLSGRYTKKNTGWKKPSYYLSVGSMYGDCTDVTNATVSVFRSLGYPAKAMFGYASNGEAHAWGEVVIGGKVYLVDELGGVSDRDKAIQLQQLTRPDSSDCRYFMWDETGQYKLDPDWCKRFLTSGSTAPGGSVTTGTSSVSVTVPTGGVLGAWKGVDESGDTFTVTFTVDPDGQMWAKVSGGNHGGEYFAWLEEGSLEIAYQGAVLQGTMVDEKHVVLKQSNPDYPDMTWELSR